MITTSSKSSKSKPSTACANKHQAHSHKRMSKLATAALPVVVASLAQSSPNLRELLALLPLMMIMNNNHSLSRKRNPKAVVFSNVQA